MSVGWDPRALVVQPPHLQIRKGKHTAGLQPVSYPQSKLFPLPPPLNLTYWIQRFLRMGLIDEHWSFFWPFVPPPGIFLTRASSQGVSVRSLAAALTGLLRSPECLPSYSLLPHSSIHPPIHSASSARAHCVPGRVRGLGRHAADRQTAWRAPLPATSCL